MTTHRDSRNAGAAPGTRAYLEAVPFDRVVQSDIEVRVEEALFLLVVAELGLENLRQVVRSADGQLPPVSAVQAFSGDRR